MTILCPNCGHLVPTKHGHAGKTKSKTYKAWESMLQRCYQPSLQRYARYGGRGIGVCDQWRYSFYNFLQDMGEVPVGKTLERINVNGNYEPSNCRWATKEEQANNRTSNRFLSHGGKRMTTAQWARATGIPSAVLRNRLHRGWTVERAITQPVRVL